MPSYYNENDAHAAGWLRNLVAAGHLPAGTVDDRSILDVEPGDLDGYDECHFFAGIGGWPYALALAGWHGPVWTGSCPCQPLSSAGQRRGHADERHLWPAFQRLIAECRPPAVLGEQVASKDGREWLAGVRADLEHLGYAIGVADLPAAGVGAPHIRQRLFWVADGQDAGTARRLMPLIRKRDERGGEARPEQLAGCDGATGGLADADGGQPRHGGLQPGGQHRQQPQDGGAGQRLADAEHAIGRAQHLAGSDVLDRRDAGWPQAHRQPGACREVSGMGHAETTRHRTTERSASTSTVRLVSELSGHWSGAVLAPCLDGKARRTQPGVFPLAHGVPARVGRLRAYGNAIVPQAAAAFVMAFMEARR